MNTVKLEKVRFELSQYLSKELIESGVELQETIDGYIRLQIRGYLYGEVVDVIKYPKDWFEAFKERWFPEFLLKRFPAKYTEYIVKAIYNKFRPSLPNQPYTILMK